MKKLFSILGLFVILFFIILIINVNKENELRKQNQVYDNLGKILTNAINYEKLNTLSFSIALSEVRAIEDILLNDSLSAYEMLSNATNSFKRHLNKQNTFTQIIAKNFTIYARSWENIPKNSIKLIRKDLIEIFKTKKPTVSIQLDMPPGIKALSAIIHNQQILAILETTTLFDSIVQSLRKAQIETIPLISKQIVPKEYIDHKNFHQIQNRYIAINKNTNKFFLKKLQQLTDEEFNLLLSNDFLEKDGLFFSSFKILDSKSTTQATFILAIKKDDFPNFIGKQQSILRSIYTIGATKNDIYNYAKQNEESIFNTITPQYIINYNHSIESKDRMDFTEVAREKLNQLSKKELIDLILHQYQQKAITGEIR